MAHLKITTPDRYSDAFAVSGDVAHVWLNGEEISKFLRRVELDVAADGVIAATLTIFLSSVEVDLPAVIRMAFDRNLPDPQAVLGEGIKRL